MEGKKKTKPKKPTTRKCYEDDYLTIYTDSYNYIIEVGSKRYNYGSLRGLFYSILCMKVKGKLSQKCFETVKEFQAIHDEAISYVKMVAVNMADWK